MDKIYIIPCFSLNFYRIDLDNRNKLKISDERNPSTTYKCLVTNRKNFECRIKIFYKQKRISKENRRKCILVYGINYKNQISK